jgi:hypothetical protein
MRRADEDVCDVAASARRPRLRTADEGGPLTSGNQDDIC